MQPTVEISPEASLWALDIQQENLRDERDQAQRQASVALARANRASVALIATSRERAALQQEIARQRAK